jgi:hypothetical protein
MTPHQRDVPSLRALAKPTFVSAFSVVLPSHRRDADTDGHPMIFSLLARVDMFVG